MSSYLPITSSCRDRYLELKTEVLNAIEFMNAYQETDETQIRILAEKVNSLRGFVSEVEQELEKNHEDPVCGRSKRRCRRYSLFTAETCVFLSGVCLIVVDYVSSGTALSALKISGAGLALFSKCLSNVTTICIGNADENKSVRDQELESIVGDKSFVKLATAALEEVRQAYTQVASTEVQKEVANKAILKANEAIENLRTVAKEEGQSSGEREIEPPHFSFLSYASRLRQKLHGDSGGSRDFVVKV